MDKDNKQDALNSQPSIETYGASDGSFGEDFILTRSARIRKFKFYQYKSIQSPEQNVQLLPRDDVLQGKVPLFAQSKELAELDAQIKELDDKIADLDSKSDNHLDAIFELVNKKNDLLRRQMQVNILEQEKALEKANQELTKELRSLMNIEDSRKTKAQLERQQYLYEQSLALVEKRNQLVLHLDVQEQGIEDDNAMKANLKTAISEGRASSRDSGSQDQNCCIQ